MSPWNRWILAAALLLPAGSALADRGDIFFSAAPAVDVFESGFGGALGLQVGVNPETDLFMEAHNTVSNPGEEKWELESAFLLGSFYTPYFGEIRPRLGGSVGLMYLREDDEDVQEMAFNCGVHLQGLYDLTDGFRLFAEVHPNITMGEEGDFTMLAKVGILIRLSK